MSLGAGDRSQVLRGICPKCEGQLDQNETPVEGMTVDELVKPMKCMECDALYHIVYEYEDVREVEE